MSKHLSLAIIYVSLTISAFTQVKITGSSSLGAYYGWENKERHVLIIDAYENEYYFHITVPRLGNSCFLWGEHGGKLEVKSDTLIFYLNRGKVIGDSIITTITEKEVFKIQNPKKLKRISEENFMHEKYKWVNWNK